jgi:hypothetical protein
MGGGSQGRLSGRCRLGFRQRERELEHELELQLSANAEYLAVQTLATVPKHYFTTPNGLWYLALKVGE